jgi:transglutaminase-like putative cysteine protease
MKIEITHKLRFDLGTPTHAVQHLLLTPSETPGQTIERWSIEMPGMAEAAAFRDAFGNRAHLVSQSKPTTIEIVVRGTVDTIDRTGVVGRPAHEPMPVLFKRVTPLTGPDAALPGSFDSKGDRIALLHELMDRVHARAGATAIATQTRGAGQQSQSQADAALPPAREFAHAFIAGARALDIPARYVTGYCLGDDEAPSGFHAWAEAWDDGLGWIGFDASLNLCPTDRHVRLATGLDAMSTMPVRCVPVWAEMPEETVTVEAG